MIKKVLVFLLTIMSASPVLAGDSGLYYNAERDGEGILLLRNKDTVVNYFFTYEPHQGCWGITLPKGSRTTYDNCHEQRWFFSADEINDKGLVKGFLYAATGLDYPYGVPDPVNPFAAIIGEAQLVGLYVLQRSDTGWRMVVARVGEFLDEEDPLFDTVFDFQTPLFEATD